MQTRWNKRMRIAVTSITLIASLGLFSSTTSIAANMSNGANNFYQSNQVTIQKVTFKNQYNMNVVGNLVLPKNLNKNKKSPAIVIGHPMGAVKEQSSMLYAKKLAEQGFVTLAIDLSFWGESEGQPRNAVAPDIYAEDFSAAVDYLGTQAFIDQNRIGALGICAGGGFVISAAKIDTRMKAIATVSLVDMGTATRGFQVEDRKNAVRTASAQRYVEFTGGKTEYTGGTVNSLSADSTPLEREFYDFYRTPRGEFTPQGASKETTTHPTLTSNVKFMNFYPLNDIETISPRPMLFIAGDNAVSKGFSEEAYKHAGQPKELFTVPNAGHVDLYDRVNLIPFDKLTAFFSKNLK